MSYSIIDRRKTAGNKNLPNEQRLKKRKKAEISKKMDDIFKDRSIKDTSGKNITIPNGTDEPDFIFDKNTGTYDYVLPGNKEYITGDTIKKPKEGGGSGSGKGSGNGSDGEDSFLWITPEEYLEYIFEGLELPNLEKESEKAAVRFERHRAGYSTTGSICQLDIEKTFQNSLGRRIALLFPLKRKLKEAEEELLCRINYPITCKNEQDQNDWNKRTEELKLEIESLKKRISCISYLDDIDTCYRRYENVPKPSSQAVCFFNLDVSGSMGEHEKDIAKRFYFLLYIFLKKIYKKVDIVFITHTEEAKERTEYDFFHSRENGGTLFSPSIQLVTDIIAERYPIDEWNVYVVSSSDGDSPGGDNDRTKKLLQTLIPNCQYYIYLQTLRYAHSRSETQSTVMWNELEKEFKNFMQKRIFDHESVVKIFKEIFSKKKK